MPPLRQPTIRPAFHPPPPPSCPPGDAEENVVSRLKRRMEEARGRGFQVRTVLLDGADPSWCLIGRQRIILLELNQGAAEQLASLEEILRDFRGDAAARGRDRPGPPATP